MSIKTSESRIYLMIVLAPLAIAFLTAFFAMTISYLTYFVGWFCG